MPPKRTRAAITAAGFEELAAELDEQRQLLEQILQVCRDTADGLGEHRAHTRDSIDRLGTRMHSVERRTEALEKVAGRGGE